MYTKVAPLYTFNEFTLLIKKLKYLETGKIK
jgi:hypothetical protein